MVKNVKSMGSASKKKNIQKVSSKQDQKDWNEYIKEKFPGPNIAAFKNLNFKTQKSLMSDFRKWQNAGNRSF
tara:strand:- start:427 stop:642 length:216 start_codon:yes stop_codon:yes gene_type:complete